MKIKPACRKCKKPYLVGRNGICHACLEPGTGPARLRCLCGRAAVVVILATVLNPEGASRTVQLALCRSCLKLEREDDHAAALHSNAGGGNPIQILVVDRLPKTKNPPKGRRLA